MGDPLAGCFAKLERAREHGRTLHDAIQDYRQGQPYTLVIEENPKTGWNVIRFECEPVPLRVAVIVGDMIRAMHSSLDNLVWQLVLANSCTPGRHNSFPIHLNRSDFVSDVGKPRRKGKRTNGPLSGVGPKAWAYIESLQPYHRRYPELTFPAVIKRLSNMDKHESIAASVALAETGGFTPGWDAGATLLERHDLWNPHMPLKDKTDLFRLRFAPGPDPNVQVEADLSLEIFFGDSHAVWHVPSLNRMRIRTYSLVESFRQFL